MIRALFVDDEPAVLEGLENRLRRLRRRWTMSFAVGGERALEALDQGPIDVVVSDMRMPGMDGAEFLTRVRDKYPHVVRIILSGQTSHEQVLRALPVAHRFLSKPCDSVLLEAAVERASTLHSLLHDERIRAVVGGVTKLPSAPDLYVRLTEMTGRVDASASEIAEVVAQDVTMTGRILQLVNSSYFGLSREMVTAREAVAYLGANTVRALVLTVGLFAAFEKRGALEGFSLERLQQHALRTAGIASSLVSDPDETKVAFTAAVLHDVGALVMATLSPERCVQATNLATSTDRALEECERELHGFGHAEVGAALLSLWGLPYSVVEAVAFHHRPNAFRGDEFGAVGAVHVADRLVHEFDAERGERPPARAELDVDYLERMNVEHRVTAWRNAARTLDDRAKR